VIVALLFAGLTLRELARRRVVAAAALLTLLVAGFSAWGLHRLATTVVDGSPLPEPAVRAMASGVVLLLAFLFAFVLALGAALVGGPAAAESIANGEMLAVLARPIRRADVLFGRWLGVVAALGIFIAVAGSIELAVVRLATGYLPPHPLIALAYLTALATVVATAAVALATRLPAVAAGVVAAVLFGLAWIGGILEAIGLALGNVNLADSGTIVTLLFPSDAFWRGANYALEPAVFAGAAGAMSATGAVNPFAVAAPPPPALLVWAAGWIVAVLAAGIAAFRARDF
jgi:ABC-type transport system involved in multi-copper enzyme maturation permease subunit